MSDSFNPYAVSEVQLEPELQPGERVPAAPTQRVLATLADWAIYAASYVGALVLAMLVDGVSTDGEDILGALAIIATTLCGLLVLANLVLLARRGQTFGKILLGIRIADRQTGRVPGFVRVLLLRVLPLWVLSCFAPMLIAVELVLLYLAEGRTICDYMAGTQVVRGHPPAVS